MSNKKKKYLDEINAIPKEKSIGYYAPNASEINGIPTHNLPIVEIVAESPYKLTDYQKAQASKIKDNFKRGQYLKEQDYYNKTRKNKFTNDINYLGLEAQKRLGNLALSAIPGVGSIQPFIKYEDGKLKEDFSKEAFIQSGINTALDFLPIGDLVGKGVKNIIKYLKPNTANKHIRTLKKYGKNNGIDMTNVDIKAIPDTPYAIPVDPAYPDGAKHVIHGFEIPLSVDTKQTILSQSLPRLNKLLKNDYTTAYTDVLNSGKERILNANERNPNVNFTGYVSSEDPNYINLFTDYADYEQYGDTKVHETIHALVNNLDTESKKKLYNIVDNLFNKNGLAVFNSKPNSENANLSKKLLELESKIYNPQKSYSNSELRELIDEYESLVKNQSYGLGEALSSISESRTKLLKNKIKPDAPIEEQDVVIDAIPDEELLNHFRRTNEYTANYINQIAQNNGNVIPKYIVDYLRSAYKILPMGTPAVINNNKNDK